MYHNKAKNSMCNAMKEAIWYQWGNLNDNDKIVLCLTTGLPVNTIWGHLLNTLAYQVNEHVPESYSVATVGTHNTNLIIKQQGFG